jgi:hypothetical protein
VRSERAFEGSEGVVEVINEMQMIFRTDGERTVGLFDSRVYRNMVETGT